MSFNSYGEPPDPGTGHICTVVRLAGSVRAEQREDGSLGDVRVHAVEGELVHLVECCLSADPLGYALVYGVSSNRRRWWYDDDSARIGFRPVDDAERHASRLPVTPASTDDGWQGGELARGTGLHRAAVAAARAAARVIQTPRAHR